MQNTSDIIEIFLKDLIDQRNGELELKRNELALKFNCAPSQINYVLATRFTLNRGYVVTSRKGGGGFIRITSIDMSRNEYILHIIEHIGNAISEAQAIQILRGLYERDLITAREAKLMSCAMKDNTDDAEQCNINRASTLKSMMNMLIE